MPLTLASLTEEQRRQVHRSLYSVRDHTSGLLIVATACGIEAVGIKHRGPKLHGVTCSRCSERSSR